MLNDIRSRIHEDEQGVTLIELLVVMVIMGLIGTVALTSFISTGRATVAATAQIDAITNLTPGMQRLTRDVRAASPLIVDVTADYANRLGTEFERGGVTYRNNYYVQAGADGVQLFTDRFEVAADGTLTTIGTNNLVAQIDNPITEPVFRYYNGEGIEITCLDATATCRDQHLTATKIGIRLFRAVDGSAADVEYQTTISIRNTRFGT